VKARRKDRFKQMSTEGPLLEVCVDSVESAIAAENGGADRVELCSNLDVGGTTPSLGLIESVRSNISIPLHVMIRPRGGDFCYSNEEIDVMERDISAAKRLGADGVVFGVLTEDRSVDTKLVRTLLKLASPLDVTFHRAFDVVKNPLRSLEGLIALGVPRILTSGQGATAMDGLPMLIRLMKNAKGRTILMPGSGINERNVGLLLKITKTSEIHVSSGVRIRTKEDRSSFGFGSQSHVDSTKVRRLLRLMKRYSG
jgi:copper homeostasis protein